MSWKNALVISLVIGCVVTASDISGKARASVSLEVSRDKADYLKTVAGFGVRLVAVADATSLGGGRLADHAWTPDGTPYEGAEARLYRQNIARAPGEGLRRWVVFELEQPQTVKPVTTPYTSTIDVFTYLVGNKSANGDGAVNPGAAGPYGLQLWHGVPSPDYLGRTYLVQPTTVVMDYGVENMKPRPVVFGIAQGEFKVVAKASVSPVQVEVNQTKFLTSGPWGRIEVTHLPQPEHQLRPTPNYSFRLLGGAFPPKTERKALFYDSEGRLVASCGDGPNNPGYAGYASLSSSTVDIASVEIQERPYEFAQFDGVCFNAPHLMAYSGQQGLDHAVDSSIGRVVGVVKPTKDGPWLGSVLYAADGVRWLEPGTDLGGYEYGGFDPGDHPLGDWENILFEASNSFSASPTPSTCEVYAVDSPEGARKERLSRRNELTIRSPVTSITCNPTNRPYMRVEVRVGDGTWNTIKTLAVTDRMVHAAETAPPGTRVLEVFLEDDGSIRIWKDEDKPIQLSAGWRPRGQRIRAMARLNDGSITEVNFNMGGYGGVQGHERRYSGLEYIRQSNGTLVQSGAKNIDMRDIAALELQVQDLKPVVTFCVHSPKG